jgi:hypothetical protein
MGWILLFKLNNIFALKNNENRIINKSLTSGFHEYNLKFHMSFSFRNIVMFSGHNQRLITVFERTSPKKISKCGK